ncbi:unnamed protein product [Symbiodinium sp. CCMP2592]|nr:unnamed protein product [Symbiodinium sp. CCMP2592]
MARSSAASGCFPTAPSTAASSGTISPTEREYGSSRMETSLLAITCRRLAICTVQLPVHHSD